MEASRMASILAELVQIFGMDVAKSLRIVVAQNQKGGPLTDEEVKKVNDNTFVELMPKIVSASGISAQQLQDLLAKAGQ